MLNPTKKRRKAKKRKWVPRLSKEESEKRVYELLDAGAPFPEIAYQTHKSISTITKMKETLEKSNAPRDMSTRSAALKLLKQGLSHLEVAIKLDLSPPEVEQYRSELMRLEGMEHYNTIYLEMKDKIQELVSFYDTCKMRGINLDQIPDLQKLVKRSEFIRSFNNEMLQYYQEIRQDTDRLVILNKNLESDNRLLEDSKRKSKLELNAIEHERSKAKAILQTFKSDKDLAKIKSIINAEMNHILKSEDNNDLIQTALSASISTFLANPRFRQLLEPPSSPDFHYPLLAEFIEIVNELIHKIQVRILDKADDSITEKIGQLAD